MTATLSLIPLSGSTDGQAIKVVATASTGTLIHTATSATAAGLHDLITLRAYNSDTVQRLLTIQWGGTTSPDDDLKIPIEPQTGELIVVERKLIKNSKVIRAYAAAANVITINGECMRFA